MRTTKFYKSFEKKSKRNFLILLAAIAGVAIFIIYFTVTLPYFYVKDIQIKGLNRLSYSDILQSSSISPKISIFKLNLAGISKKIQYELIMVRKVIIRRKLPSTLVIEIEERAPYVYVKKEEKIWEVDEEGVVLGEVEKLNSLTRVTGVDPFKEKNFLLKALKALNFSQALDLRVEKITINKGNEGIVLILEKDIQVILGTSPNYHYLSYLPDVLEDAKKRGEKFNQVDLRFEEQIVVSK
ncbi:FtsQ-type POTRA domain-containing protein [Candidatus Aerophobetes bacterium]|nr:FtsQ-type POTRA domain-containing protein [Candidatus Aerophobetes bacterium]